MTEKLPLVPELLMVMFPVPAKITLAMYGAMPIMVVPEYVTPDTNWSLTDWVRELFTTTFPKNTPLDPAPNAYTLYVPGAREKGADVVVLNQIAVAESGAKVMVPPTTPPTAANNVPVIVVLSRVLTVLRFKGNVLVPMLTVVTLVYRR